MARRVVERTQQRVHRVARDEVSNGNREPSLPTRFDLLDLALDLLSQTKKLAPVSEELYAYLHSLWMQQAPIDVVT